MGKTAMTERRATQILHVLRSNFCIPRWADAPKDPFQVLIMTVLSQATADRNSERAFRNLSKRFPISPKNLASARVEEIEAAIRVAGLYRNKSKVIKELSRLILEKFGGSLNFIHSLPLEEARKTLICLPVVGPKTAEVASSSAPENQLSQLTLT